MNAAASGDAKRAPRTLTTGHTKVSAGSLRIPRRNQSFALIIGVILGMVAAGLAIPLGFGSKTLQTLRSSSEVTGDSSTIVRASEADAEAGLRGQNDRISISDQRTNEPPTEAKSTRATLPRGTKLRATDRGVTADSVTIGILIADTSGAGQVGIDPAAFDPAVEEAAWKAFIAEINARGGIHTRKINPVFRRYDALSDGSNRAACLDLTQDKKVFSVFNVGLGYGGSDALCVTKENRTPFLKGDPESGADIFQASAGYFSSSIPHADRENRNLAWELHQKGLLKGRKIGVVASEGSRPAGQTLLTTLRTLGYRVEYVTWFSEDLNTAQSQAPNEVLQHKQKGIQVEFLVSHFVDHTGFVQHADSQQFFPMYAVNDIAGNTEDIATTGMPRSFESVIGITFVRSGEWRSGIPESASDRACRQIYERGTGETLARSDENTRYIVMFDCDMIRRFEAAAAAAGTELTRDRLVSAIQNLGERSIPYTGGGSYKPGKVDGADFVRTKRWSFDCKCWRVTEDFRRGRF